MRAARGEQSASAGEWGRKGTNGRALAGGGWEREGVMSH
jgi:hypothetical protein